jgi:hypothetical protein
VPLYAKSAATLLALAGKEILMGCEAELGPLDVQVYDPEKGDWDSALNAAQSLERLNAYALTAFDQAMLMFMSRTTRKPEAMMPMALNYATSVIRPLVEKIDTIELTRKSRELKVAEDYAVRLMRPNYLQQDYLRIARVLVERFSEHGFIIDRSEADMDANGSAGSLNLGLHVTKPSDEIEAIFDKIASFLERDSSTVIGRIEEVKP